MNDNPGICSQVHLYESQNDKKNNFYQRMKKLNYLYYLSYGNQCILPLHESQPAENPWLNGQNQFFLLLASSQKLNDSWNIEYLFDHGATAIRRHL
jgi:hypothetical protein